MSDCYLILISTVRDRSVQRSSSASVFQCAAKILRNFSPSNIVNTFEQCNLERNGSLFEIIRVNIRMVVPQRSRFVTRMRYYEGVAHLIRQGLCLRRNESAIVKRFFLAHRPVFFPRSRFNNENTGVETKHALTMALRWPIAGGENSISLRMRLGARAPIDKQTARRDTSAGAECPQQ